MEYLDTIYKIKELGLKLVEFSYAHQYADMADLNDIAEFKDELLNDLDTIKGLLE